MSEEDRNDDREGLVERDAIDVAGNPSGEGEKQTQPLKT